MDPRSWFEGLLQLCSYSAMISISSEYYSRPDGHYDLGRTVFTTQNDFFSLIT